MKPRRHEPDIRPQVRPGDQSGVDFMELLATPIPVIGPDFERRVDAVVRALDGLDRRGIHDVLEAAGKIARGRTSR